MGARGEERVAAGDAAGAPGGGWRGIRRWRDTTMLSATFNPAQAEKLFAGTGHTFAEMLALADAQKPLPRFALDKS